MEKEKTYLISDASKKVEVESHVLRYWEDELKLPVKRNELGHRYYTEEDITEFREIKKLKEQGLQLKAIRMILKNGKLTRIPDAETFIGGDMQHPAQGSFFQTWQEEKKSGIDEKMTPAMRTGNLPESGADEKVKRLEYLMKRLISEAVQESNQRFYEELSETLTKELDYQFRMQEEREDARESRQLQLEEEHYKKLDELLRGRSNRKKQEKMEKEEKRKLFKKKKA